MNDYIIDSDYVADALFNSANTLNRVQCSGIVSSHAEFMGADGFETPPHTTHDSYPSAISIIRERVAVLEHEEIQNNLRIEELEMEVANIKMNLGTYVKVKQ